MFNDIKNLFRMARLGIMIIKNIVSVNKKRNFHWTTNFKKKRKERCSIFSQFKAPHRVPINTFMSKYSSLLTAKLVPPRLRGITGFLLSITPLTGHHGLLP